jgi:hypothetical protein
MENYSEAQYSSQLYQLLPTIEMSLPIPIPMYFVYSHLRSQKTFAYDTYASSTHRTPFTFFVCLFLISFSFYLTKEPPNNQGILQEIIPTYYHVAQIYGGSHENENHSRSQFLKSGTGLSMHSGAEI